MNQTMIAFCIAILYIVYAIFSMNYSIQKELAQMELRNNDKSKN